MNTLSKLFSVIVVLLLSTNLPGQNHPNYISGLESYVEFMNEANRKGNKYLVDFASLKDSIKYPYPKEYKNEIMILEESIQNSLIISLITTDMIAFINLSGYIQFLENGQLKNEALVLMKIDVIENYTKRIDVMIKAATQNLLLTNSRTLLTMMYQFRKDLGVIKEKLIEIQINLLKGTEQLTNHKDE